MSTPLTTVRWLVPTFLPIALFVLLTWSVRRRTAQREPSAMLGVTFVLGAGAALVATAVTAEAARLTGLEMRVSEAGQSGALVFVFLVVAPLHEAGKVAAAWPALLFKREGEAYDGVVYAAASALGFSALGMAWSLQAHPFGVVWVARTLLALPAEVFFACLWGYGLGRAKHAPRGLPIFPAAFVTAAFAHGLYAYFLYGRGPGALLAVAPLLGAMGFVVWLLGRDLLIRTGVALSTLPRARRRRRLAAPPSLAAIRAALQRTDEPLRLGWIFFGSLVTLGAMIAGIAGGVAAAHALGLDLAGVDEHDLRAAWPALLLAAGLLAAFPTSGWLIARAAGVRTLLEPALATVLALVVTLVTLGLAAPFAVVFALALSPIAWLLACIGAWAGRSA